MTITIGVDTGGTFTDFIVVDENCTAHVFKTPSQDDPLRAISEGLKLAAQELGLSTEELLNRTAAFCYGSTSALNSILERKGARVGALVTRGFRDTLEIRRMMRTSTYDILEPVPMPFVRRDDIEEITERVDYQGNVLIPLNEEEVRQAVKRHLKRKVESLAICFLHSYAYPHHELRAAEIARKEAPDLPVSVSYELVPEIREYERFSTTVFNAYISGQVSEHLTRIEQYLSSRGLSRAPFIMGLQGGVMGTALARARPVGTLYSGPVAGVIAGRHLANTLNEPNVITMDMGGTSFDVSLIWEGEATLATQLEVEHYPMLMPRIEVRSIGAGGGSIAWVDASGRLKVGPHSAGAHPGPICYGQGGKEVTVTDADVCLGYINPDYFLGGRMELAREESVRGLNDLSRKLSMTAEEVAAGIYEVVNANMVDAIRLISVQRGYDPRELVGMAFGGAGPTHAAALYQELGTRKFIIPKLATAFSAFGLLCAEIRHSVVRTYKVLLSELDHGQADLIFAELYEHLRTAFAAEGVSPEAFVALPFMDVSYKGQPHSLTVPLSSRQFSPHLVQEIRDTFNQRYKALYGFVEEEMEVQLVNFRLDGVAPTGHRPAFRKGKADGGKPATKGKRSAYFRETGGWVLTPVYEGEILSPGQSFSGPAIIEYQATTAVLRPGQTAQVDEWQNLVIS